MRDGQPRPAHARHPHDRHRLPGVRAVVQRQRPDQRQGLRVRGRVRRRRARWASRTTRSSGSRSPFNNSYKPGAKDFDFDINQISITPERAEVVDFSDGYYSAAQAVVALKGTAGADATSLADLKGLHLGAQTGTTSLTAIRDVIQPDEDPLVFEDTNAAKQALQNGQVDAILADLPTAFYITAVEIPNSTIVGQFQPESGEQEEFGMLFEKGSELVPCVNQALATLRDDGTLDQLEQQWLSDVVDVPELQ